MSTLPPFEPPYQALSPEFGRAMLEHAGTGATQATSPAKKGKAPGPAAAPKSGVFFLVVPFAQKEEAKALGARWDAAAKKWYVPLDKDLAAFKRWLPKA